MQPTLSQVIKTQQLGQGTYGNPVSDKIAELADENTERYSEKVGDAAVLQAMTPDGPKFSDRRKQWDEDFNNLMDFAVNAYGLPEKQHKRLVREVAHDFHKTWGVPLGEYNTTELEKD